MAKERFLLTALPYSCGQDAEFHVSLFVSPDLLGDANAALRDFTYFPSWAKVVKEASEIKLFDQTGQIDCEAILDPIDPELWVACFPGDTPVTGREMPDWSDRYWRSFDATAVHDSAKLIHLLTVLADPAVPPEPALAPANRIIGRRTRSGRQGHIDETTLTAALDEELGEGSATPGEFSPRAIEGRIAATEDATDRLLLNLHRVRRYYERPEAQTGEYRERPLPDAVSQPPERKIPDFHERMALVGDHGPLLRMLGLVIDLRVGDPQRLRSSEYLSAQVVVDGDPAPCQSMRTACRTAGDDLVSVAGTQLWSDERLRIGDNELFSLLELDVDGSALKLERYLWGVPRLVEARRNGDPVHAATPALRSTGLTVVHRSRAANSKDRVQQQRDLQVSVDQGQMVTLRTEDVTRGFRVEVWDDSAGTWSSLHGRRVDVEVDGFGVVINDLRSDGFIQGTAANETAGAKESPIHVHEALFGWEGWSLSVPKPGKRVRHENGHEIVEDQDANPDPLTPIRIRPRIEPGTLPRLRYGRSYAFRAWAVDLAGNVRPHDLNPTPLEPRASAALQAALAPLMTPVSALAGAADLIATFRGEAAAGVLEQSATDPRSDPNGTGGVQLNVDSSAESLLGPIGAHLGPEVSTSALERLVDRRSVGETISGHASNSATNTRSSAITGVFRDLLVDPEQRISASAAATPIERIAEAVNPGDATVLEPNTLAALAETVSPIRPFLRWEPIQPPAVVPRDKYSAGESLRHVVIRSGVTQDSETLAISVTAPIDYATAMAGLDYRATSERHLAPPKTSQVQAELHGAFDHAIGSPDPDARRRALAVSLRESGTFYDEEIPRLDDPNAFDHQPGVRLEHEPSVETADLVTLADLHDDPGSAPAPGQYVVHDVDQLVLPYLPDVPVKGISAVFPEAGTDRRIPFPWVTEGFKAPFAGDWPALEPIRLVLEDSNTLTGALSENVLHMGLPPGEKLDIYLSCFLDSADLDNFGLWMALPDHIRTNADLLAATADGWLWGFTPSERITLVHAVPRPIEAPRPTKIRSIRAKGSVESILLGAVDVHGPSTQSLTAHARWSEPVDDLTLPAPETHQTYSTAFTVQIGESEDLAILGGLDSSSDVPHVGPITMHKNVQHFGDTRHRIVTYRFRAQTRFREYFDAAALTGSTAAATSVEPGLPDPASVDDGQSVVGPEVVVSIPSSARPAAPIVHSVIPLFRWSDIAEAHQPMAVRRMRRAGVRIYLERGWFSSGAGELLGVLVGANGADPGEVPYVSQWGQDPLWDSTALNRTMSMQLVDLLTVSGLDDRPGDAQPLAPPVTLPLTAVPGEPQVSVLGYEPQFNETRGLWFVDVAINPGDAFWPFVRLAVARYQPDSLPGCHLSAPVRCDFVQLPPERTLSVSRTDSRSVRVVLSGPVGQRSDAAVLGAMVQPRGSFADLISHNRRVVASLQQRDPSIGGDLGWKTQATAVLAVRGHGADDAEASWVGSVESPVDLPLIQPGVDPVLGRDWRVHVEEWEGLPGDPAPIPTADDTSGSPVWQWRLIYADEVAL